MKFTIVQKKVQFHQLGKRLKRFMRAIIMLEKNELSSYLFQLLTADTPHDILVLAGNIICKFLLVKVLSIKSESYHYVVFLVCDFHKFINLALVFFLNINNRSKDTTV